MNIYDLADLYFDDLKKDKDYQELKNLKKLIDEKYQKEILSFKRCESIYEEAKEKGYLDDNIKNAFISSKTALYEKEEVKRYFFLENKINNKLNSDLDEIKKSITNKFDNAKIIKI